ncbi:MAG TPA: class I SAM-dependent methyltransferase [Patescibacteria group bacterium]|nr:class I SAM-dependent methyltransferase [Patescibacteria group bacterium]
MQYSKKLAEIFKKKNLKSDYLFSLLVNFWFAPCDAFLRAPEIAIWKNIKFVKPTLNIGCSDGRMDRYLFEGKNIDVALDNDRRLIKLARKSGLYKKTILTSADKIPFEDEYFSTIVSNSTFEHIKNDLESVKEASRVLKKGGSFILTTTNDRFLKTMFKLDLKEDKLKRYNKRVNHYHYKSEDDWVKILKDVGFSKVYTKTYDPDDWMRTWWILFRMTTLRVYKRELWSYLKDSPYGKLFPKKLISTFIYETLLHVYKKSYDSPGNWLFIWAIK